MVGSDNDQKHKIAEHSVWWQITWIKVDTAKHDLMFV